MNESGEIKNVKDADIPALLNSISQLLLEANEQAEITVNKSLLLRDYREDIESKELAETRKNPESIVEKLEEIRTRIQYLITDMKKTNEYLSKSIG